MAYPVGMFEFAILATMSRTEAARATTPLMMTMLPGPAAQRSAVAAVAVTTQVQDGLRRERTIVTRTVEAMVQAAKDPDFTTEALRAIPGMRDVASDAVTARIHAGSLDVAKAVHDRPTKPAETEDTVVATTVAEESVEQAVAMAEL